MFIMKKAVKLPMDLPLTKAAKELGMSLEELLHQTTLTDETGYYSGIFEKDRKKLEGKYKYLVFKDEFMDKEEKHALLASLLEELLHSCVEDLIEQKEIEEEYDLID